MAGPYRYVIGPVVEYDDGVALRHYGPPEGCISWIDLRRMSEQSALGRLGYGFFTMPSGWVVPSGYHWLGGGEGDCRSLYLTQQDQSAWSSLVGVTPTRTASTVVVDALDETLTDLADPTGENSPKPLVPRCPPPGPPAEAEIILAGHSTVRRRQVPSAGRWWNNLVSLHKRDMQAMIDRDQNDRLWRKYAGSLSHKYFGRWDDERGNELIPDRAKNASKPSRDSGNPVERRWALRPETTYTDDFNRTDATTLGGSYTEFLSSSGRIAVVSNTAKFGKGVTFGTGVIESSRFDSDVSSSDHETSITCSTYDVGTDDGVFGVCARFSSSAETMYTFSLTARYTSCKHYLDKVVTGTRTNLATSTPGNAATDKVIKAVPDGSTIYGYYDGSVSLSMTDTAISSGTRGGVFYRSFLFSPFATGDNLLIADVERAPSNGGLLLLGVGA